MTVFVADTDRYLSDFLRSQVSPHIRLWNRV
jgi:hypothetical protein